MQHQHSLSRRGAMATILTAGAVAGLPFEGRALGTSNGAPVGEAAQTEWTAEPEQAPAREHMFEMGDGTRLWGWDTEGPGPAVVLMHAFTGSGATWAYQQPALVRAGFRVIGYSRRGHFRSEPGPRNATGRTIDDLSSILEQIKIDRFHLVGTAAGGFSVFDFALSHPGRLLSLTLASSQGGIDEADYVATSAALLPPGWADLPATFRELGPSYRAANPSGTLRWAELEEASVPAGRVNQAKANTITWSALHTIETPALLITGDADLYSPPSRMREVASHLPRSRSAVIAEAGHAAFWEQPEAFNRQIISHLAASVAASPPGAVPSDRSGV